MPVISPPIIKILSDLDIDLMDVDNNKDYLRAVIEATNMLSITNASDRRIPILQKEVKRVRDVIKNVQTSSRKKYKITKKTIAPQKLLSPSKLAPTKGGGEGGDLLVIKEKVVAIEALLGEQYKLQEENAKDAKQEAEKKRRSLKERLLEGSGKVWDGIKKATGTVLKPFQSVWENIIGFIKKIILGRILFKILEWTSDPKNEGKIESIFKFLGDWWPALLAAYLVFGNGLSKFVIGLTGKLVVLGAKLVAKVIPALIKAAAAMGPWGAAALGVGAVVTGAVLGAKALDGDFSNKERTDEEKEADKEKADSVMDMGTLSMNKGGPVPGTGNTDTVPAMLTPGEFVMSKGAVQRYGVSALEGMNAAAGGTNRPTLMGRYNEGGKVQTMSEKLGHTRGVVTDPKEKAQQEAYMLKYVNEERAFQGKPPLTELTYAPGVELTKMRGPGPKTTETSDTNFDFDRGIKTTSESKTMGDKTIMRGSIGLITEEDRDKFFAENPHAAQLVALKDQIELDNLGADISASAKMNGGGLVQGFQGGGSVGRVKFTGEQLKKLVKNGSTKKIPTITPPSTKPKVTVVNQPGTEEVDASQAQLPAGGNREIPPFDATVIRSSHKMEVLGISI
jgi:hypothetical protein